MRVRYKLAIFLLPVALVNGWIIQLAFEHEPAEEGTSAEFWNYACGVELAAYPGWPKRSTYFGRVVPEIDGWFVYYRQRHHDRPLYRVARSDVARDLPEVLAALGTSVDPNSRAGNQKRADDCAARLAGIDADEMDEADVSALIAGLLNGRLRSVESTDPERHARLERVYEGTVAQWRRGQRAWLSFLFEGLFLTGWMLFIAWPWLRGGGGRRKAIHLGFAPLLLHVPYYMGYAPMTFTFGPPGGFLYPLFLRLGALATMLLPPTIIDFWILTSVPRSLAPLSQVPGPPTAVTITSVGAPFMLTMLALAVVSLAAAGRSGRRRRLKLVFVWLLTAAAVAIPLGIVLVGAVWSPADGGAGIHEALSGRKARLTATAVYVAAVVGFSFVPYGVILTVWAGLLETKAPLDRFFRSVVVGSIVLSLPAVLTIARYVSEESTGTSAPLVGAIAVTCVTALLLPRILLPPLRSGAFALPPAGEARTSAP